MTTLVSVIDDIGRAGMRSRRGYARCVYQAETAHRTRPLTMEVSQISLRANPLETQFDKDAAVIRGALVVLVVVCGLLGPNMSSAAEVHPQMTDTQIAFYAEVERRLADMEPAATQDVLIEFGAAYPQMDDMPALVPILLSQGYVAQTGVENDVLVVQNRDYSVILRKYVSTAWKHFGSRPQIVVVAWKHGDEIGRRVEITVGCLFC